MTIGSVTVEQLRERAAAARMALMPRLVGRMQLDADALRELQQDRLRTLLAYASEHSPFWARRLRGVDAARFGLAQLADLPPLTKTELMREFDDAVTDRRLNRSLAERALALTTDAPVPILDGYIAQATGGSSGQRGVFVSDVDAYVEVSSAPLRFLLTSEVGRRLPPDGFRLATVAAATAVHSTGLAAGMNTPGSSPVELHAVPVTLPLTAMVTRLNAARPHVLIGYPSMLARLAGERIAGRLAIEPLGVLTTSEMLTTGLRAAIRSGLGAPIIDLFGSTEGLMGGTEPDQSIFAFNSDTCLVELVDDADRPVPVGTRSSHILLTNLCNRVQPLIRYRLDDRFTRHPDAPESGHLRATVEGRGDEILRYGGVEVHPLTVRAALLKHPEILDYQVRQTETGIDVSLLADGMLDVPALTGELRAALTAAGLAAPTVAVTRVDDLARHAETGKLRRFVPLAG
jgi:phenylacetate-coenzyme A ligase PaaK-like adenylate-forming protein